MLKINNKYIKNIFEIFLLILFILIISPILSIIFNKVLNIIKIEKIIHPIFEKIEKDYNGLEEYIPKNYNGNIIIFLDDYKEYRLFKGGHGTTHGSLVVGNFENNVKDDNNYKIIKLNKRHNSDFVSAFERIVSFAELSYKSKLDKRLYYYDDLIDYIIKENPNANIIVNQSFFANKYFNLNIDLLNKYNNLHIIQAMPYKGNKSSLLFIEIFGNILSLDHKRLLYVTVCGDYQPSFSNNVKCTKEDNTSLPTPIIGYQFFKK